MSTQKDLPNTYMVQDTKDGKEISRLVIQDRMMTRAMGGVLSEQEDPTKFKRIVDVACGPGAWLLDLAQEYPLEEGIGVDTSAKSIEYANTQAKKLGLADRVVFRSMDATSALQFPDQTFDLVNLRLGQSFLRAWEWPNMISEMLRVTHSNGTVRLVESYLVPTSGSVALTEVCMTLVRAFVASGRLQEATPAGMAHKIAPLLHQHGAKAVQSKEIDVLFRQGTEAGQAYYQDIAHIVQTVRPFLQKFANIGKNFDDLGRQALQDMQQPGFELTGRIVVAWGKKAP
ncbi:MAG: class I SAM-dependent methyltransferase [Ktedonobacteraceae bacterium]|nr:class I SAM-dependent methyltransferase [Ktedonobacteraceae bacterium]